MFQHTAARRRLARATTAACNACWFQHTAARRRLERRGRRRTANGKFQHTAARRRLAGAGGTGLNRAGFNTQPPEGGWTASASNRYCCGCFNTQPPEGGWTCGRIRPPAGSVSTHSRPKAAGAGKVTIDAPEAVSTHSRPKAAGCPTTVPRASISSFNTQPPEGGWVFGDIGFELLRRFNTQPPEGGWGGRCRQTRRARVSTHSRPKAAGVSPNASMIFAPFQHTAARRRLDGWHSVSQGFLTFQHTAARRRLGKDYAAWRNNLYVSTHSRPKAAGPCPSRSIWFCTTFQHTAARRRLDGQRIQQVLLRLFQHTAARRRLDPNVGKARRGGGFNTQPPEGGWISLRAIPRRPPVSTHSRPKAAGASLKSLAPSGFAAPISLGSQEKREREYNTAFSVTSAFTIS